MGIRSQIVSYFGRTKSNFLNNGSNGQAHGKKPAAKPGPSAHTAKLGLVSAIQDEPKDDAEFIERMLGDYQVQFALRAITGNMQSAAVAVTVEDGDERSEALAEALQKVFDRYLPQMLPAIAYGRVAFEKIFAWDAAHSLLQLKCLDALPYRETSMVLDEVGEFDGIDLECEKDKLHIEACKAWWLALDATVLEPHGRSQFKGAPRDAFKRRMDTLKRIDIFMRRWAIRGRTFMVPMTETDENGNTYNVPQHLSATLDELLSGGDLILPSGKNETGEDRYRILETTEVMNSAPLLAVLTQQETEQIRSFGFPEKTISEGDSVGSHAMVKMQTFILFALIDGLLWQFCESFQDHVIDPLVDRNEWSGGRPKIEINFPRFAERPDSILAQVVVAMFGTDTLNELFQSGAVDVQQMLEDAGIPVAEDVAVKLQAVFAKAAAVKAQAAQAQAQRPPFGQAPQQPVQQPTAIPADMGSQEGNVPGRRPFDMAWQPLKPGPHNLPADIPTYREQWADVLERMTLLYFTFVSQIRAREYDAAYKTLKTLREFQAESSAAYRVLGALTPWKPEIQQLPSNPGIVQQHVTDLAAGAWDEAKYHRDHGKFASKGGSSGAASHHTQSPAFKNWFGDSKVVDADGKPLVLFHGTSANFNAFGEGSTIKGLFATDAPEDAARFADPTGGQAGANIMPVHMALKNPRTYDEGGKPFDFKRLNSFVVRARNDGHDGVIVKNVVNFPGHKPSTTYIAFHPTQIKSATGNKGTFDPTSHRIDLAATIAPAASDYGRPFHDWHFPWLDAAADWLGNKRVMPASNLKSLIAQERSSVFSAPGIDDTGALNKLKQSLASSLTAGESLEHAAETAEQHLQQTLSDVGLSGPQFETLFRTNTHQAFMAGQDGTIHNPAVMTEFPYVMLVATHDGRTRETHRALDGFVVRVGEPEYNVMRRALNDYGCRCARISLDAEQAQARGIKTLADFPPEVLAAYA